MRLDIERVWFIECYRCANSEEANFETADEAVTYFECQGWQRGRDGFQMCPQCLGRH